MASKLDSVAKWAVVAIKRHPFAAANVRSVIRIMKCVRLALLLLGCWTSPTIAIVGDATPGNPFADSYHVVLIEDSHGDGCTGVALARNIVLTAAHCVIHVDHKYQIAKVDVTPVSIPVASVELHPQFDPSAYAASRASADLAIVILAEPLPSPINAPMLGSTTAAAGEQLTITGYGVGNDKKVLGTLRSAKQVVTGNPGKLQLKLFDPETRNRSSGLSSCAGDAGGPAVKEQDGKITLVGIMVWGTGPNDQEGCGGLTGLVPIRTYGDWIIAVVKESGGSVSSERVETTRPSRSSNQVSPSVQESRVTARTLKLATLGCKTREDADKFLKLFAIEKDKEATQKFVMSRVISGDCRMLDKGQEVSPEETPIFSDSTCVRPKGEVDCLWVNKGMVTPP